MQTVQFEVRDQGRRLGVVVGETVHDVTAVRPDILRVTDAFAAAEKEWLPLARLLQQLADSPKAAKLPLAKLLDNDRLEAGPVLRPAVDHSDLYRVLVTGTGLTHLGSMQSRDAMHTSATSGDDAGKSDSKKMFEMGIRGGKPAPGTRGTSPEWFYKGSGWVLRAHRETLEIPSFALDGGEEPEVVGCYVIDSRGTPRRLGFALGNEWSDHETEKINYLYLAPSKLRQCSLGPVLNLDSDFQDVPLHCTVKRDGNVIYDSGPMQSGQLHMCHTLANCEDHHFKFPQHRVPGDVHLHFFGTSQLSHGQRKWVYRTGDEIRIESPGFSPPLVNAIRSVQGQDPAPVTVVPA